MRTNGPKPRQSLMDLRIKIEGTRQTGAENRIDENRRAVVLLQTERVAIEGLNAPQTAPSQEICPRIFRQFFGIPVKVHIHSPAPLLQEPRHDKPVAAVVARPAQNHRLVRGFRQFRPCVENCLDNAPARAFHQLQSGNFAAVDRGLFGGLHLGGCQQICHVRIHID